MPRSSGVAGGLRRRAFDDDDDDDNCVAVTSMYDGRQTTQVVLVAGLHVVRPSCDGSQHNDLFAAAAADASSTHTELGR